MELIKFLQQRVSYHVHELSLPAPAGCDLETILQTAMSTPDYGNLNPWHFLVIDHEQVEAPVELLSAAWVASDVNVGKGQVKRLSSYLRQAPILSAAAACQMILLGADASGYGGVWYSKEAVDLPNVKEHLHLNESHVPVGFLVLGTPVETRKKRRRCAKPLTSKWSPQTTY
ncbi:nitroreductase family protein [Vibrio celticus]|uniref:Putative NAD(P)H nitroreductase YdjA n=1 Tax=Vibrio celticus TaxID=446372 RepID=A0A1C3JF37_9VIBR|nr:nitroreductase family protein [Vibrio celticus]SBT13684.1 Putative NAD(P)H nitroreductase YdjA [Vibrio celticus]